MRRVLVTGSRKWTDREAIFSALSAELANHGRIIVIHGDNPNGADAIAHDFHLKYWKVGAAVSRHPAKWHTPCGPTCTHERQGRYGPYYSCAGNVRNQYMVDLGPDICYAFPLPESIGTWDCIRRAENAEIKVVRP